MDHYDHELLALLANDLHHHFQQLVLSYQQRLYSFAHRLTGSWQNAEDIVQEAFVSAYVSLENYPDERIRTLKLQAWLYRITLNVYTHSIRGSHLQVVPLNIAEDNSIADLADRVEEQPEALFEHLELRQELEKLLAQLPERYRISVTCYYFEYLSYQEIAELLDQPVGTVKSSVFRGIRLLRTLLQDASKQEGSESITWKTMNSIKKG
jgi:RNA polymerase sigma-70 factor (ECF subfamily)